MIHPSRRLHRYLVLRGSFAAMVVLCSRDALQLRLDGWVVAREVN